MSGAFLRGASQASILLLLCAGLAPAQQAPEAKPAEKKEEAKKPKQPDRFFAVKAGRVYTVSGPVLRDVTILSKNGQIVAIGPELALPEKCEVLDASDYRVYPGLVAFNSTGIVGPSPEDSTDVYGLPMALALSTGITTVGQGNTIAKLTWGTLEGHVLGNRPLTIRLRAGNANQKRQLREALEEVREYQRKQRAAELAKARGEEPEKLQPLKGKGALFARLLSGEVWAHVNADKRADLTYYAQLAVQYGFRLTIEGGAEAWTVAPLLSRAGARVILNPRGRRSEDPRSNRQTGWSIENAARLHQHGIPVAIMSKSAGIGLWGLAGTDLLTLTLEAGFAVRGGLSEAEALKGLTLNPARFMGAEDSIGSIEVGKHCDLVITRGDLLHYESLPEWTIVNGRVAYDKSEDSLFRHVRARGLKGRNRDVPTLWPRAKGSAQPEGMEGE